METTITIKQKMSGTGTIHDINSDTHDRAIKFLDGRNYAVVMAAYCAGSGYVTFYEEKDLIDAVRGLSDYAYTIIDREGRVMEICGDRLVIKIDTLKSSNADTEMRYSLGGLIHPFCEEDTCCKLAEVGLYCGRVGQVAMCVGAYCHAHGSSRLASAMAKPNQKEESK